MNTGQRVVLGSWLAVIGAIVLRGAQKEGGLPQPGAFLAAGVVFTALYGLGGFWPEMGGLLGAGTATAVWARPYLANQPNSGPLNTLVGWLDRVSGTPATSSTSSTSSAPTAKGTTK